MKARKRPFAISIRLTGGEAGCFTYMLTKETERIQLLLDRCDVCEVTARLQPQLEQCLRELQAMRTKYDAAWDKIRPKPRG